MNSPVKILGPNGQPLPAVRRSPAALNGGGGIPYDAADIYGEHMAAWRPYLWSTDGELNMHRDRIVSRMRDVVRNDGWGSGAITRFLDNAIGAKYRPIFKPDYRALAQYTGNKRFDPDWADAFGRALDARFRIWGNDTGHWNDVCRLHTFGQQQYLGFRHLLVDGDALAVMHWRPERIAQGRAKYATAAQIVDPDRLSNPQLQFDQRHMRGGVVLDEQMESAVAYYIRRAHQGDWFAASDAMHWERVERETEWGRPIVVHFFEAARGGQHRGGAGILTPVLHRLKMLIKYDGKELDAAIINAIFGAYIESPFDHEMLEDSFGDKLPVYQDGRLAYHDSSRLMIGDSRVPILYPGERINAVSAQRPSTNFGAFENAVLRNVAAGTGLSAQQVSNNWSDVNYSSARGALLEAWKTIARKRDHFAAGFSQPQVTCFVEESFELGELPLPPGAPPFVEMRDAYARAIWMGPGRGWVDPKGERQGAILGMDAGLSTLEKEAAEAESEDWEEVLDQRSREVKAFKDRGLPLPQWAAGMPVEQASTLPADK